VLWLVGQFSGVESKDVSLEGVAEWAPDVLRKVAKTFGQEVCNIYNIPTTLKTDYIDLLII